MKYDVRTCSVRERHNFFKILNRLKSKAALVSMSQGTVYVPVAEVTGECGVGKEMEFIV